MHASAPLLTITKLKMNYYTHALTQRYADFSSRSTRSEYWFFSLFNMLASFLVGMVDGFAGTINFESQFYTGMGTLGNIYVLLVFIPGLAVTVRRLHDTGKSGWAFFIVLIPIIGSIFLLVWMCTDSTHGSNRFGENPKSQDLRSK